MLVNEGLLGKSLQATIGIRRSAIRSSTSPVLIHSHAREETIA